MSKHVFRNYSVFAAILWCCLLAATAWAQSTDQNPQSPQDQQNAQNARPSATASSQSSAGAPRSTGTETSVNQTNVAIRNFLQNRPEVMEQLKLLLVQRLRAEGSLVDEQTVSEQQVYDRMQNDPAFRAEAVRSLIQLGYISEDDARS